jgi:hypothetical protein
MDIHVVTYSPIDAIKRFNDYMQEIPYAGYVWSAARDYVFLPSAAAIIQIWNSVQQNFTNQATPREIPAASVTEELRDKGTETFDAFASSKMKTQ